MEDCKSFVIAGFIQTVLCECERTDRVRGLFGSYLL